jgi:hypothetical protein
MESNTKCKYGCNCSGTKCRYSWDLFVPDVGYAGASMISDDDEYVIDTGLLHMVKRFQEQPKESA